jgi:PKD repeat protein
MKHPFTHLTTWLLRISALLLLASTAVAQPCVNDFTVYKSARQVVFDNSFQNPNGFGFAVWDFGDGTPLFYQQPFDYVVHTYDTAGTYTVCMLDSFCVNPEQVCKTITVSDTKLVSAEFTDSVIADGLIALRPLYYDESKGDQIQWDLGDGGHMTIADLDYQYQQSGQYNVCLSLVDSAGNYDINCRVIDVVVLNNCHVFFDYHIVNGVTQFINYSSYSDTNTTFTWYFGDGSTSNDVNPSHQYSGSGEYIVSLVLNGVCNDSIAKPIMQPDTATCNSSFTYTVSDQTVRFTIENFDDNPAFPTQYFFQFGDGQEAYPMGNSAEVIYQNTGTYLVCLSNFSPLCNGAPAMFCDSVTITSMIPICKADFDVYNNGFEAYVYNKSVVYGTSLPYNVSLTWGDGYTTPAAPDSFYYSHVYDSAGIYSVTLILTSTAGCSDTISKIVGVGPLLSLSGTITASGSPSQYTGVNIYAYEPSQGTLNYYGYTSTNELGVYELFLASGYYLVQADFAFDPLTNGFYLPTYYQNKLNWDLADVITLTSNRTGIDIDLIPFDQPTNGSGMISGMAMYGAGNTNQQGPITPGTPAGKMLLYLLDANNNPVIYTHAHDNGKFTFESLPYGTYKVWAEMAGKVTQPTTVTIDANNPNLNGLQIVVGKTTISTGLFERAVKAPTQNIKVFPNPSSSNLFVDAGAEQRITSISVMNINGQYMQQLPMESTPDGERIDIRSLPVGLYMITIQLQDGSIGSYRVMKSAE